MYMSILNKIFFYTSKAVFNLKHKVLSSADQISSLIKKPTKKFSETIPFYQAKTSNSTTEQASSLFFKLPFSKKKAEIAGFGIPGQYRLRREEDEMELDISSSSIVFVSPQSKVSEDFAAESIVIPVEVRAKIHFERDENSDSEEDDSGFGSSRSSLKSNVSEALSCNEDYFYQKRPKLAECNQFSSDYAKKTALEKQLFLNNPPMERDVVFANQVCFPKENEQAIVSEEFSFFQAPPNLKPKPEAIVTTEKKDTSIALSDDIKKLQDSLKKKLDEIVYFAATKICDFASLSEYSKEEIMKIKSVIDFIENNFITFFLPCGLWDHKDEANKTLKTFYYNDTLFSGNPFYIENKDFVIRSIEDHETFVLGFINKIEEDYKETLENNLDKNKIFSTGSTAQKFYWQNETDYLNEVLSALKGTRQKLKEIKLVINDIEIELDCLIKKDSQKKLEQSTQSIVESVDCASVRR